MDHVIIRYLFWLKQANTFHGPTAVRKQLADWGISRSRIQDASPEMYELGSDLFVRSISAHQKLSSIKITAPYSWLSFQL